MKRNIYIPIFMVMLAILISSYFLLKQNSKTNDISSTKQMKIEEVLKHKTQFVGDGSSVFNIVLNLPGGIFEKGMTLDTQAKPYGVEVNYGLKPNSNINEQTFREYWTTLDTEKIFLNNATALFALVENVDKVTFNLEIDEGKTFTITRKEMETFYGKDLRTYGNHTSLWKSEVIEDTIGSNEKLKNFFKAHSINIKKTKVEVF